MESKEVDISGIDKVELLKALWKGMKPASFYMRTGVPPPSFDEKTAKEAVKKYIDYFQGRCIKTDIRRNIADPCLYDRDAGPGAFAQIVANLKKK